MEDRPADLCGYENVHVGKSNDAYYETNLVAMY
jgi:hypothetical protein